MEIKENIKLAGYTTFGIGGNARFFCVVASIQEALEAIDFAKKNNLKIFLLGGGSNVLVSDEGFGGLVIKNEIKGFKQKENFLTFGGGEIWDDCVKKAIGLNLEGLECLSAIPGTFGGAVVQNIGAYGQTLAEVVDSVEVVDVALGEIQVFARQECGFEYRNSLFKKNRNQYLVVAAVLKLNEINRANISFYALKKYFEGQPLPSMQQVREAVIEIRASKGMVILPGHDGYKSAGSFFKNPVISEAQFEKIKELVTCPDPWFWLQTSGIKVSAACLVTQAGFKKGDILDAAQISPKQPLALINPGFAHASDIKKLAGKIKKGVLDKFGVELEEEIVYI